MTRAPCGQPWQHRQQRLRFACFTSRTILPVSSTMQMLVNHDRTPQRAWTRLLALPRTLRSRKRHSVIKQRAFRAPSAESKNTAPVAISTAEFGEKY